MSTEHSVSDCVCLSLDVDWAPDEVLDVVFAKIRAYGLPATVFVTHDTPLLQNVGDDFEIALHPSFEGDPRAWEQSIRTLHDFYPRAIGARSHRLHVSSRILDLYRRTGIRYESNVFLMHHPYLQPAWRSSDLLSIPIYWSDDKHIELDLPFSSEAVGLGAPGLKVLNFHPIHVFMNTTSDSHYRSFRHATSDVPSLANYRGDAPGAGDLFVQVLEEIAGHARSVMTLGDVMTQHQEANPAPVSRSSR